MALTKKQRNAKINKIKRINERRAEIERAVNDKRLPKEYLDAYEAAMRSAVHDSTLINARGNISHGKKAVDSISSKSLDALLQKETAGQATKKTYKYYKKYQEETERIKEKSREYYPDDDNPFIEPPEKDNDYVFPFYGQLNEEEDDFSDTYEEYLADRDYVYENMQDDPDWYQAIKAFFTGVSGLKSYHQLKQAHEKFINMSPDEQIAALQAAADRQLVGYFG